MSFLIEREFLQFYICIVFVQEEGVNVIVNLVYFGVMDMNFGKG